MIYLDNAATTQVDDRVVKQMLPYFTEHFGNPESSHQAASKPLDGIRQAEQSVEWLLHTKGHGKVIFTSGGTESNNMVFRLAGGEHPLCINMITSLTEHKSVLAPARAAMRSKLFSLKPGRKGYISADDLDPSQIPAYTLVSFMHMNNETGMINEVYEIGDRLRHFSDLDVFFHVDCVQSAGCLSIDVNDMNVDLVSVSSHKIHGPKGVGCLWISDRLLNRMEDHKNIAMILGGGQQSGYRAGTMDVPGIVGFGAAARIAANDVETHSVDTDGLAQVFISELRQRCKELEILLQVRFPVSDHHSNKILSITFHKADAETVVLVASQHGLCVSNGAACNAVLSEPSYVLLNSGMSEDAARHTIRVSFSKFNTYDECRTGADILAESVNEVLALNLTDAAS